MKSVIYTLIHVLVPNLYSGIFVYLVSLYTFEYLPVQNYEEIVSFNLVLVKRLCLDVL